MWKQIVSTWSFGIAIIVSLLYLLCILGNKVWTWSFINDWMLSVASFIWGVTTFLCGVYAHRKQTSYLENMKETLNEVEYIIKGNITTFNNASENACVPLVKLTLYAMYHAYNNRKKNKITCKIISKEHPDIVKFIILTIFASFRSEQILGRIGDDGCIVIDVFNKDIPKNCTSAYELLKNYEHMSIHKKLHRSINRINNACGLKPLTN